MTHLVNTAIAQEILLAAQALACTHSEVNRINARGALYDYLEAHGDGRHVDFADGAVTLVMELARGIRDRER